MDTDSTLEPGLADAVGRLRDQPPAEDLWPGIARQLKPRHPRGTLLIRWPTALAAGLLIALATSASTAVLLHRGAVTDTASVSTAQGPSDNVTITASFAPGDAALARAIDDLELAVRASMDRLDPVARSTVHQSLLALDAAIAQAAARQSAAPGDPGAARYLTSTLRKKLQLLRTVSQIAQPS